MDYVKSSIKMSDWCIARLSVSRWSAECTPLLQCWNLEQSLGAGNRAGIGMSYRPARLRRLAESIPWNSSLGSLNVYKFGLCTLFLMKLLNPSQWRYAWSAMQRTTCPSCSRTGPPSSKRYTRRKIILIESNAKCRYLKKVTGKGTLWQVFYLSHTPPPLTHCTVYVYTVCILIHTGKGGWES